MADRIGIVCTGIPAKLRENEADILRKVGKLVEKYPDAAYVCFEKRSDRMAFEALEFWGVTPEVLILDPADRLIGTAKADAEWNGKPIKQGERVTIYDHRKPIRDGKMKRCDKVLVFVPRGGSSEWREYVKRWNDFAAKYPSWGPCNVFLSEYGEAPPPKPKVRRAKKRKAQAFA